MDAGFPYGDLIVIGAIAAFILLRYRAMLGESRGRDEMPPPTKLAELERVIQLPTSRVEKITEKKEDFANHGSLAETFVSMRAIDREFSPEDFLSGARAAYGMVIAAYSKRDRATLNSLLSPELRVHFERSLKEAEAAQRFDDTTLVGIGKATITDAQLSGNLATITVDFSSEQIHLVRDANGVILEGNPSHKETVEDHWVFTRDLKSTSPNWTIIET